MSAFNSKLESLWHDARSTQAYLLYVAIVAFGIVGVQLWTDGYRWANLVYLARLCLGLKT